MTQGTDTADATTRQGGGYLGATYNFLHRIPLSLRYTLATGDVVDRMPLPRSDGSGAAGLDVPQHQYRHTLDLTVGYRVDVRGAGCRFFFLPMLGPRALFLVDKVSPNWALEGEVGGSLGVASDELFEFTVFGAYARALAKQDKSLTVYGPLLGETRFGAEIVVRPEQRFGLALGYEGDLVIFQSQIATNHQLHGGVRVFFD